MDRIFSIGDMSDHYWQATAAEPAAMSMNRSSSEWAFERFLQEANSSISDTSSSSKSNPENDALEIKTNNNGDDNKNSGSGAQSTASVNPRSAIPIDSDGYQAFLKNKLDLACAAVALTRAPFVINQNSTSAAESAVQGSATTQSGSLPPCKGSQDKDAGGPIGIPSLPCMQTKPVVQTKQASYSSGESDDDEAEGENETAENTGLTDVKRVRRMLSNRESARRSRRRKQAHLTELETQVSQIKVENSSLLKRFTDISQKYNEAAVDNRVLKADVETLRAKVKMAEETVKRVTGMNPLLQAMSEITAMGMPFRGSHSDSADTAVLLHDDPKQPHFYQPINHHSPAPGPRVDNGMTDIPSIDNVLQNASTSAVGTIKMGITASMQRVASLEHLQKRIRGGMDQGSPLSGGVDQ